MARRQSRGSRRAYLKRFSAEYVSTGSSVDKVAMMNSAERSSDGKAEWFQYNKRAKNGVPFMLEGKLVDRVIKENLGEMNKVVFIQTSEQSLTMYFSGNVVFFIQTIGRSWKRSIVYPSTDRAKRALRMRLIVWVEQGTASGDPPSA